MVAAYDPMKGYSTQQHIRNRERAAAGFKLEEGVAVSDFQVGEGIIILNLKGEPSMSGIIEKLDDNGVSVGGTYFPCKEFIYRRL